MLRVGLTGNIASGKSTVIDVWRRLGARVIDADLLAREAVQPGSVGLERVRAEFGDEVIGPDGLDRAALRRIVFRDHEARSRLESIVHPIVRALREERERELEAEGAELVVNDTPLLFETGMQDEFDAVVLVDAPPAVRHERILAARGLAPTEAQAMIEAQMPAEAKRQEADWIIDNDGTLEELERRAEAVWEQLQQRAGEFE